MGYIYIMAETAYCEHCIQRQFDSFIATAVKESSVASLPLRLNRETLRGNRIAIETQSSSAKYELQLCEIQDDEGDTKYGIAIEITGSIIGGLTSIRDVFGLQPSRTWEVMSCESSLAEEIRAVCVGEMTHAEYTEARDRRHFPSPDDNEDQEDEK